LNTSRVKGSKPERYLGYVSIEAGNGAIICHRCEYREVLPSLPYGTESHAQAISRCREFMAVHVCGKPQQPPTVGAAEQMSFLELEATG
jgi:hypothetical protein